MGTGLSSQIISEGWEWSLVGFLFSTIGCAFITIMALVTHNFSFRKKDLIYLFFGLTCISLYLTSKDPLLTTLFAVFADLILGIPTLLKAYRDPAAEKSYAWYLGFVSWTFSLIICFNHSIVYAIFPIYLFLFNGTMVYLSRRDVIQRGAI